MAERVSFLGIGLMGKPMALRLLAAGYPLTAWNRTREKAQALEAHGARSVDMPGAAVQQAQIVIVMLEHGGIVHDVLFQQRTADALSAGSIVIDMSSTKQSEAIAAARALQERGVHFLDAPVSGGVIGAEKGSLAIMVGGERETFVRAEAVLSVLGRATYVGPSGSGQLAKLGNQIIVAGTLAVVAEALLLARAGGADPAAVRQALRGGFADSRILEVHGERMLARNFAPGGKVSIQLKDLENALAAAREAGVSLPFSSELARQYQDLLHAGYADLDQSAILLQLERLNPKVRGAT